MTFRPTHDVGPRTQCMSGLNYAAYGLPVNASRPGSPQAHASLGSGWRPTLAGWDWIPTGFRTRFRRSHHVILSPLTGAPAGLGPAVCRAVGVAAVARRTDRKEAVAPAAGLLAKGLVHSVGVPGRPPTGRRNPNRGTTIPTGSVCRRARRSRGSGGPVRTLTYVCVHRYATRKTGSTPRQGLWTLPHLWTHTTRPQDACKTARRAVSHKRPQPILFVLIKNPEELRDHTDATTCVQTCALSRDR